MKRILTIAVGLALLAVACGDPDVGSAGPVTTRVNPLTAVADTVVSTNDPGPLVELTPVTTIPGEVEATNFQTVGVYFVQEGLQAEAVARSVDASALEAETIRALLEGPTEEERARGLRTTIPDSTLFLGAEISAGLATIDLSREFEIGGGMTSVLSRLAQVVYTITQFPTVDEVSFRLDGAPVTVFSGEGVVLEDPVTADDYATILPLADGPAIDVAGAWQQDDLTDIDGVDPSVLRTVVLMTDSQALAVRAGAGAGAPVVGSLAGGAVVVTTGSTQVLDGTAWFEVETPAGVLWTDESYLAEYVSAETFSSDDQVDDLLGQLEAILERSGDLREVVSRRGLWLSYNAAPILIETDRLEGLLTDQTATRWPDHLISVDDPAFANMPETTFAQEIADPLLAALRDPAGEWERNGWLGAEESGIPEAAIPIPVEFRTFNSISVQTGGGDVIDWKVWYLSIDYEDGKPRIAALTFDAWVP